jgi:hypothetical protein
MRRATSILVEHPDLGGFRLHAEGAPELLFTENDTNHRRLWGVENSSPFVKDAFHEAVVHGNAGAVNPAQEGSKAALHYRLRLGPGESVVLRLRLTDGALSGPAFGRGFDALFAQRQSEADEFYGAVVPTKLSDDATNVMRQALAGMLWSKQWYHYDVRRWLDGDPAQPPPPSERQIGRNSGWTHLYNDDVVSMPDKWEYPWYAAWDLAFHTIALALVDPEFAKGQLTLFLREWYMHPNGQIPAYEWALGDVNPPVHAWAAWRVYKIDRKRTGRADRQFLEGVFHKLLLNFNWWVNRKDAEGMNVFQGGFLGLDNIGVFDRSAALPTGGHIEQSDGTSWMAMFSLNMLAIALELARENPAYEGVASKFFEHFVQIAHAMDRRACSELSLWDEEDGFFYDALHLPGGEHRHMKVRSLVGLIPLLAVETLEPDVVAALPGFRRRLEWFVENRPEFREHLETLDAPGGGARRLLSIVSREQLPRVLRRMLDEDEFLSPHGIRAVSQYHRDHPYVLTVDDREYRVDYEPAESTTGMFGGNSNWRGPVWMPVNYLLVRSLQRNAQSLGEGFEIEYPTGSGRHLGVAECADDLRRRLVSLFLRGPDGRRPCHGWTGKLQDDPRWRDNVTFHEYFHGDDGAGLGASHQTGWTGLVADLICRPDPFAADPTGFWSR